MASEQKILRCTRCTQPVQAKVPVPPPPSIRFTCPNCKADNVINLPQPPAPALPHYQQQQHHASVALTAAQQQLRQHLLAQQQLRQQQAALQPGVVAQQQRQFQQQQVSLALAGLQAPHLASAAAAHLQQMQQQNQQHIQKLQAQAQAQQQLRQVSGTALGGAMQGQAARPVTQSRVMKQVPGQVPAQAQQYNPQVGGGVTMSTAAQAAYMKQVQARLQQQQQTAHLIAAGLMQPQVAGGSEAAAAQGAGVNLDNALNMMMQAQAPRQAGEDDAEEVAEETVGESFAEYVPAKWRFGVRHPHSVVESSSLAAVEPPNITYKLHINDIIAAQQLSVVQAEAIVYACQRHEQRLGEGRNAPRAGFFLGDGAGVGKGRTIAGLLLEHWRCGRKKAIWVSTSSDLINDAKRDLSDIGAGYIPVLALNKLPYKRLDSKEMDIRQGVLFVTYSTLTAASDRRYTRVRQLLDWAGKDFEGVIAFDESHKAKNLVAGRAGKGVPTKTGLAVKELQDKLPAARIMYCSATGVSELRNIGYMTRLGLWGPHSKAFPGFTNFLASVGARGVGAMELIAMDMKARGMYLCRMLSYAGAEFQTVDCPLPDDIAEQYSAVVAVWWTIHNEIKAAEARLESLMSIPKHAASLRFWGAHQRFFRMMCIAAKVPKLVEEAKEALAEGQCVVIGLQSTGESVTESLVARGNRGPGGEPLEEYDDFVSGPKELLTRLVEEAFPLPELPIDWEDWQIANTKVERSDTRAAAKNKTYAFDDMSSELGSLSSEDVDDSEDEDVSSGSDWGGPRKIKRRRDDSDVEEEEESSEDEFIDADASADANATADSSDDDNRDGDSAPATQSEGKAGQRPRSRASNQSKTAATSGRRSSTARRGKARGSEGSDDEFLPDAGDESKEKHEEGKSSSENSAGDVRAPPAKRQKNKQQNAGNGNVGSGISAKSSGNAVATASEKQTLGRGQTDRPPTSAVADLTNGLGGINGVEQPSATGGAEETVANGQSSTGHLSKKERKALRKERIRTLHAELSERRQALIDRVQQLSLPTNPLDALIEALGGPTAVAEMTGRAGRLVRDAEGRVTYQRRNEGLKKNANTEADVSLEAVNLKEKELFLNGQKLVAIISEAASAGISLHADRRIENRRRRIHFTLELPWSADRAIQQLGRSHRANQTVAPLYKLLFTPLGGERRFAAAVAKRLASMGALTQGDRRAGHGMNLDAYNFDDSWGQKALKKVYSAVLEDAPPVVDPSDPESTDPPSRPLPAASQQLLGKFRAELVNVGLLVRTDGNANPVLAASMTAAAAPAPGSVEGTAEGKGAELPAVWASTPPQDLPKGGVKLQRKEDQADMTRFLNRLLGVPPSVQQPLFRFYQGTLRHVVEEAKRQGTYDAGITDLQGLISLHKEPEILFKDVITGARTLLYTITVDRGIDWNMAKKLQEGASMEDILQDEVDRIAQEKRDKTVDLTAGSDDEGAANEAVTADAGKRNEASKPVKQVADSTKDEGPNAEPGGKFDVKGEKGADAAAVKVEEQPAVTKIQSQQGLALKEEALATTDSKGDAQDAEALAMSAQAGGQVHSDQLMAGLGADTQGERQQDGNGEAAAGQQDDVGEQAVGQPAVVTAPPQVGEEGEEALMSSTEPTSMPAAAATNMFSAEPAAGEIAVPAAEAQLFTDKPNEPRTAQLATGTAKQPAEQQRGAAHTEQQPSGTAGNVSGVPDSEARGGAGAALHQVGAPEQAAEERDHQQQDGASVDVAAAQQALGDAGPAQVALGQPQASTEQLTGLCNLAASDQLAREQQEASSGQPAAQQAGETFEQPVQKQQGAADGKPAAQPAYQDLEQALGNQCSDTAGPSNTDKLPSEPAGTGEGGAGPSTLRTAPSEPATANGTAGPSVSDAGPSEPETDPALMATSPNTTSSEEQVRYDDTLLNRRVKVYWDGDDAWYKGTIDQYRRTTKKHHITYDDGDEHWVTLREEKYHFLPAAATGRSAKSPARQSAKPLARRSTRSAPTQDSDMESEGAQQEGREEEDAVETGSDEDDVSDDVTSSQEGSDSGGEEEAEYKPVTWGQKRKPRAAPARTPTAKKPRSAASGAIRQKQKKTAKLAAAKKRTASVVQLSAGEGPAPLWYVPAEAEVFEEVALECLPTIEVQAVAQRERVESLWNPGDFFKTKEKHLRSKLHGVVLALPLKDCSPPLYRIAKPNLWLTAKPVSKRWLLDRYTKMTIEAAEKLWHASFTAAGSHGYAPRVRTYHLVVGAVMPVWHLLEGEVLKHAKHKQQGMKILRLQLSGSNQRLVGILVPEDALEDVKSKLVDLQKAF